MNAVEGLAFHHVGVACTAIAAEERFFAMLGYRPEGEIFDDPVQGIRGRFLAGQSPRVELLEPLGGTKGVLAPWLAQGVKLYHLAYLVPQLAPAIDSMRAQRAKLVVAPVPAVAFGGREIAFLMLPNRLLVELIVME
ncbi:MAG TPA: VOC family protein [Casimicrobiaceae bacterium]|jgi:methylmalonyl-CoA/ethylmalonyl-CoA epimerase|nr:VOC family protein [Casimicrobiaceae bacterium]